MSLAPSITAFTPSAAPVAVAVVQSPPYSFGAGGGSYGGHSHSGSGGGHVAAVPIASSGHHRPIAVQAQKLPTRGSYGGSGNRGPVSAAHFAQRMTPGYDPAMPNYSPQPSPISLSSSSGSSSSGVASSSPATPAGAHDPRLLGVPGAGGSAGGTPSPEPFFAFAHPQAGTHHVDIYVPQSPMVSPMMSPHAMRGDQPPAGGMPRRDSVDEVAQANAHLHNILWRNAGIQLQNAATLRHVMPMHTMTSTPVNDSAQPNRGTLSSPKPSGMSAEAPGTPTTTERALSSHPASPNVSSTRAIPISRGGAGGNADPHKQLRLQPSVLAQLQAAEENSTPGGSTHASAAAAASREGSRRGSVSNTNTVAATTTPGSFISSSSPTLGSSLSTSYTVLSHTPPQRSDNPQDHDCCFSPAQQAAYFKQLQSYTHQTPNGSTDASIPSLLPMMHSLPHSFSAQQSSHSPTLRHSSLTYSLAQHRQAAGGGAPTAPGTPQRAMLSKFASSPNQGFAPTSSSVQSTSYVPPASSSAAPTATPTQAEDPAAPTPSSYPG